MKLSSIGWSAAGLAVPLTVAMISIPWLLNTLGTQRFGLLTLAWGLTAAAGMFDLGIGRATTRLAAGYVELGDDERLSKLLTMATRLAWISGLVGTFILVGIAASGATQALKTPLAMNDEVRHATYLLALNIPFQAVMAVYRGACEAQMRFRAIGLARMLIGVAHFTAPLAVAQFTNNLVWLVASLLFTRIIAWFVFMRISSQRENTRQSPLGASQDISRTDLLRAGGWFTVSSLVSPFMVQSDRFFIATMLSAAAVSAYVVPFELVTQLLIVVSAISTVAFPALASLQQRDSRAVWGTFRLWLFRTIGLMLFVCSIAVFTLPSFLPWWVGAHLTEESVRVGQILCIGVFINAMGVMFFALLHALGKFKETAILHLLELPAYIVLLLLLIPSFGILGAAYAWLCRVAVDTIMLFALSLRASRLLDAQAVQ